MFLSPRAEEFAEFREQEDLERCWANINLVVGWGGQQGSTTYGHSLLTRALEAGGFGSNADFQSFIPGWSAVGANDHPVNFWLFR